jgi:sarcosine oxidase subunit beta
LNHPVEAFDVNKCKKQCCRSLATPFGGVHYKFGVICQPAPQCAGYAQVLQDLGGKIMQHSPVTGFETGGKVTGVKQPMLHMAATL